MLPGPIPEHPVPASRSGQDSYVSKGGPLVCGGLSDCQTTPGTVLRGQVIYSPVTSTTQTSNTLKSPGIPTLPRWIFKGGTEYCALRCPFCVFSEPPKAMEIPSSKEQHLKPNKKTNSEKIKSVNPPPDAIGAVKIFP